MLEPEEVSAILRLNELGWGAKRIAQELGISRNTAKEYIAAGGWTAALRGAGKIVVDATRAFSGKQSLHVTGKMNADHANISRPIQTTSPTAYVRFMYYGTSYPASAGVHTRLARLGIQTYGYLPMRLAADFPVIQLIHAADERIPVEAVDFGAEAIYQAVRRFG